MTERSARDASESCLHESITKSEFHADYKFILALFNLVAGQKQHPCRLL